MPIGWRFTAILFGGAIGVLTLIVAIRQSPFITQTGTAVPLDNQKLHIGYTGGPLLAPLYAAIDMQDPSVEYYLEGSKFNSSGDIGYALLSGDIDAGFIEPGKALKLVRGAGNGKLRLVGSIQYPFGATVVVRKDISIRLEGLEGCTVAAAGSKCDLKHRFAMDVQDRGINTDHINFVFLPMVDMIPALESKAVDAIVTKSATALQAQLQGHKILYQNWQMEPGGDECCPAVLSQIEYFLVVRTIPDSAVERLVKIFQASSQRPSAELRRLTEDRLGLPPDSLADFPMAYFLEIDDVLKSAYTKWVWRPE